MIPLNPPKFICEWGDCPDRPAHYIIHGCLEGHLDELMVCIPHAARWADCMPNLRCLCGGKVEGFDIKIIRDIHPTWYRTLLRNQDARRANSVLPPVPPVVHATVTPPQPVFPSWPLNNYHHNWPLEDKKKK